MKRKRILCPESDHLELVDCEPTPLGALITGCSRFLPRSAVECGGECAARMDHRERRSEPPADTIPEPLPSDR